MNTTEKLEINIKTQIMDLPFGNGWWSFIVHFPCGLWWRILKKLEIKKTQKVIGNLTNKDVG